MSLARLGVVLFCSFGILIVSGCGGKDNTPTPAPAGDTPKVEKGASFGGLSNPYNPPEKTKKKAK